MTRPRILIVEGDPQAAETTARLLRDNGYDPLVPARSCREALERAESDHPVLAIVTLCLPGACDGLDAAALLREGLGIPVIVLTDTRDPALFTRARAIVPATFMPAEPDPACLLLAVESALARRRAELDLLRESSLTRATFDALPTAVCLLDTAGAVIEANGAAKRLLEPCAPQLVGACLATFFVCGEGEGLLPLVSAALAGETSRLRARLPRPDGTTIPVSLVVVGLPGGAKALLEIRPCQALGAQPGTPETDLSQAAEGFLVIDADENVRLVNQACLRILEHEGSPPTGAPVRDAVPEELATALCRDAARIIAWNEPVKKEMTVRVHGVDKTLLLSLFPMGIDEASRLCGALITDITDRKQLETQLAHMAFHDPLTGLPNRSLCLDRIRQALERSKRRDNYQYAVIFLDLDRFKIINDSLGHHMGDRLLEAVARRLRDCVRGLDTVARLGGDEFVVLLEETGSYREIVRIVKRIRAAMTETFEIAAHEVHVSASMGIVMSPALYDKPEELLRNANIALHRAKTEGRNRFKVFNSRMLEDAIRLMDLENDLRLALKRGEFHLDYQPILALHDRHLTGFEALVRWHRPGKGIVAPMEFIPVAEETGLIVPLGLWVLEEACRSMADWQRTFPGTGVMSMSVNVSAKQLSQPSLVEEVETILRATGLDPRALKLEITETVIMDNPEVSILRLKRLKALGVRLSVDDFGTGYSSLSYLQRFPIDTLKVDRAFVSDIEATENRKIVGAVVALAHSLGLDVVAEGVELEAQSDVLSDFACEAGQGFLFSRPVSREAVEEMLGQAEGKLAVCDGEDNDRPARPVAHRA